MPERRRILRHLCEMTGHIQIPNSNDPFIECSILDISTHGAFILPAKSMELPASFSLAIGEHSLPHSCRVARLNKDGIGIEFLDPVRQEIEDALIKSAFQEELFFELVGGLEIGESDVRHRVHRAVGAMMDIIEKRNAMTWDRLKAA